jgi:hypothetical protein
MFIKCTCNACSGHLEFEETGAGSKVICPHCGWETVLFVDSPQPLPEIPAQIPAWKRHLNFLMLLGLGVLVVGCLIIYGQLQRHRSKKPNGINPQKEQVTGAFGWALGEVLRTDKHEIATNDDGTLFIFYGRESDPGISPFDEVHVSATAEARITSITCSMFAESPDRDDTLRILRQTLSEKYGLLRNDSRGLFRYEYFGDNVCQIRLEESTATGVIEVNYQEVPAEREAAVQPEK